MDRICRMGAARECGEKVWKTLMSIDISRNKMTRSERTLICTARFCCLNQDVQDVQDEQDGCRLGMRCKGLEALHVYRHQQEREAKVR